MKNKNLKFGIIALLVAVLAVPAVNAFAAVSKTPAQILTDVINILKLVISLLFIYVTIVFFWGVIQYIMKSGSGNADLDKSKDHMIWGIIGMAVMALAWGLVTYLGNFMGVNKEAIPTLDTQQNTVNTSNILPQ